MDGRLCVPEAELAQLEGGAAPAPRAAARPRPKLWRDESRDGVDALEPTHARD